MSVQTYSASKVILSIGGYNVEGWDKITISPDMPTFRQINGIRGKNARVRLQNTGATIKVEVPLTSVLNPIFYELVKLDAKQGTGRLEITVKDVMGWELFSTTKAYVEAPAEAEFSEKIASRVWTIRCLDSERDKGSGWGVASMFDSLF